MASAGVQFSPREHAAVVIGRNATNKSTLLRAIAIGVASLSDASAMMSAPLGSLIRTGASQATIRLTYAFETGETVVATKEIAQNLRGVDECRSVEGPSADELNLLVCGYGAARGITGTDSGRELPRVRTPLPRCSITAVSCSRPELTLRRLADYIADDERYQMTLLRIARLIGLDDPHGGNCRGEGWRRNRVEPRHRDQCFPSKGSPTATGSRSTGSWICSAAPCDRGGSHLKARSPAWSSSMRSTSNLHPELQAQVVTELTSTFPRIAVSW